MKNLGRNTFYLIECSVARLIPSVSVFHLRYFTRTIKSKQLYYHDVTNQLAYNDYKGRLSILAAERKYTTN